MKAKHVQYKAFWRKTNFADGRYDSSSSM